MEVLKKLELSRLSYSKPAKVWLTKVWLGLSRLSWTLSPRQAGAHSRLTAADSTEQYKTPEFSMLSGVS